MAKILILHGPNLNLLGTREPGVYGNATLAEINTRLNTVAETLRLDFESYQDNAELGLLNRIHEAPRNAVDFIIFNPAAFTHTSIALRDALAAVDIPFIEVHLSNVHAREEFRRHSYFSDLSVGTISGFGPFSYELALKAAADHLKT